MAGKKQNNNAITTKEQLYCTGCDHDKKPGDFYKSYGATSSGLLPYCKDCVQSMSLDNNNEFSLENFKRMLIKVDRPYLHQTLIDNMSKYDNVKSYIGFYFKDLGMVQNRTLKYKDSIHENGGSEGLQENSSVSFDDLERDLLEGFRPTKDMLIRWGTKYKPEQYIRLESFYNDMKTKNNIETPQEEDYLKKLAVISMKMDEELELGNYSQAKSLGDLFSKYMADSKFRAMDKTEADKTGGIRSFSMIFAEVESPNFIPPWETYRKIKGLTQDMVDKTIMHLENFTARLNKVEKMTTPPLDTPKLEDDELGDI